MRTYLFIGRIVILTSVALICGLPALSAQATDHLPGAGIPEFMGAQPASDHNAPSNSGCSGSSHLGGRHRERTGLLLQSALSHVRFYLLREEVDPGTGRRGSRGSAHNGA